MPASHGPKSPSNQSVKIVTSAFGGARGRGSSALRAGERELDERRVREPGRAPGRVRGDAPVVGGAGDVEVDPGLRHELLDEQGALHEAALVVPREVDEVAVPALHVGAVLVDEGQLPVALAAPGAGLEDLVDERLR